MTTIEASKVADEVVAKLAAKNALRGCPLDREQQEIVANLADSTKRAKKWVGIVLAAFILVAAKDAWGYLATAWGMVTR